VDFSSFQCVIFFSKWWDTFNRRNLKEDHESGLICINSKKMWVETTKLCFPKTLQPSYPNVLDGDWWFIVRHDLRFKHIFENKNVTMLDEEDNQGDGSEYLFVNALFQHLYSGCVILLWVSIMASYVFFFIL
jgi:hypothetical protein